MAAMGGVSLAGWALLLANPGLSAMMLNICTGKVPPSLSAGADLLQFLLSTNPPLSLGIGWCVMVFAMMPMLIVGPLEQVWLSGSGQRRHRAAGQFAILYLGLWVAAGAALFLVAALFRTLAFVVGMPVWPAVAALALGWQVTPWRRRFLALCHRAPDAHGAMRYTLSASLGCVGACWALMLVPLVAGRFEALAMLAVSAFLLIERWQTAPDLPGPAAAPGISLSTISSSTISGSTISGSI